MDTGEMVEKLGDLMRLDVDAERAYEEAIEHADEADVRGHLQRYRDDHRRHADDLRATIRGLGQEPPEPKPDFKGYLIEGMTKLRAAVSGEQALKAMHQNEEITNRSYRDAVQWDVPADVHDLLQRNYADEQRHIAYIEDKLHVRAGEERRY
ncbi:MAG: DUF2383 domain-containing protein [Coriobacteriia bacterium]|nr:DUF2383 domain-containing protein [Coriobacteriia bacterium]